MDKKLSIEHFPLFERQRTVNTPLSLEACHREGIDPSELLHKPFEYFSKIDRSPEIQQIYFNYFEKKRKLLIEAVKKTRKFLVRDQKSQLSSTARLSNRDHSHSAEKKKSFDKTTKSVSRFLSSEALCNLDLIARRKEQQELAAYHSYKVQERAKIDKRNFDLKSKRLEEKEKNSAARLKKEKEFFLKRFKDADYDQEVDKYIQRQSLKERESKKQEKNRIIEEHLKRKEENMKKLREDREEVLKIKDFREKERQESLKLQLATTREFFSERSKKKAEQKAEFERKSQENLNKKKKILQVKLLEESKKTSNWFLTAQKNLTERSRSQSQERMKKGLKAKKLNERSSNSKLEKYQKKYEDMQSRLSLHEELSKKAEEIRRHKEFLKQFNKEYNSIRQQKIQDYQKHLIQERLNHDQRRLEDINKFKENSEKIRIEQTQKEIEDKEKLSEIVYNLKVTKNWKRKPVKRLLELDSEPQSVQSVIDMLSVQDAPFPKSR